MLRELVFLFISSLCVGGCSQDTEHALKFAFGTLSAKNRFSRANIKWSLGRCEFYLSLSIRMSDANALDSNDLEWDGESKRIIAVGDGREKRVSMILRLMHQVWLHDRFGHAFMMDTGTSTGEITGHNKVTSAFCSGFVYVQAFS